MPTRNDTKPATSAHDHPNNAELRRLVEKSALRWATAMTLFNRGRLNPVMASTWEAWMAPPGSPKLRPLSDEELAHALAAFARCG